MRFIFLLLAGLTVGYASGQSAQDSVKAAINTMFTAMRTGDKDLFLSVMSDSAVFQGIAKNKAGKTVVYTEDAREFAAFVGQLKKDSADERITFDVVKVDGPLAFAWTPYNFYLNGKFSHCGVNSFQLVRFEGTWKIQYIIDTRRRANCP